MAGASFRLVTRLMILAVFAMILGQAVSNPSGDLSLTTASFGQRSSTTQTALEQEPSTVPGRHHGNAQGPICCFAGDCPMLTLALPVTPSAAPPTAFRPLAYRHDPVSPPDGLITAPLLRPPRLLV